MSRKNNGRERRDERYWAAIERQQAFRRGPDRLRYVEVDELRRAEHRGQPENDDE